MRRYKEAKFGDKWYIKTSFSRLELQPLEYTGSNSNNGFYQINSLTLTTFTDKKALVFSEIKEVSKSEATFILNGNITGTITYAGDFYGNAFGVGKLLTNTGWFIPINLNPATEKPKIIIQFSNIVPKLSKISWKQYNTNTGITKINLLSDGINISNKEITTQEILLNESVSILDMYKNRRNDNGR